MDILAALLSALWFKWVINFRRLRVRGWLCLFCVLASSALWAQEAVDPVKLFRQLDDISIDPAQIYVLQEAHITRDRVNFYFNRGFIGFLTPVNGEITGAIFAGDGEVLLMPPDTAEKRSLAYFTQSPILEEKFTSVYLRFTDETARELLARARPADPDDYEQPGDFVEHWNPVVRRLNSGYSPRILQDLLGGRDKPFFHAYLQGVHLGIFQVSVDERLPEAVRVIAMRRSHGMAYVDAWCSFPSRRSAARLEALLVGAAQVRTYKIDTRINLDHSLEGRAELELESHSGSDRVLVFELSRLLKVTEINDEEGRAPVLLQNTSGEGSDAAGRGNDWMLVVLPAPYPVGTKFRLNFAYVGSVVTEVGNGVLYVGERGSWYPNRGLSPRGVYDLTFHYPEHLTLVATGDRVEEKTAAGWKLSRWVSRAPIPVAGFNLGAYESRARRVGNTLVEAYAAREAESSLARRHAATQPPSEVLIQHSAHGDVAVGIIPKPVLPLDPAALLDRVAEDAAAAVQYYESIFGPFPYPRLAISQIPGYYGQGWPGLVYLPTLSFLPESERARMGMDGKAQGYANELAMAHEVAHQWWGNNVGWQTYRDQWLSEGFATYAAALLLAREKDGDRKFRMLMQGYKDALLSKNEKGETIESGGPMLLGQRLSNSLNPQGYDNIVYKKACWVIHMLRGLMTDPATGSDERFFRMLREFLNAYRGQYPSTQDFIRHAEKYMTRELDLEKNHRLDWFFAEWVSGTGIPTYRLNANTRSLAPRKFVVEGTIEQSGVPPDFEMLVPVTATYAKDRKVPLGRVVVTANGGRFRFTTSRKPVRVGIDGDAILAVVR
jgi:hypothetical protein